MMKFENLPVCVSCQGLPVCVCLIPELVCGRAQHEDAPILENQLTSRVFSEARSSCSCLNPGQRLSAIACV